MKHVKRDLLVIATGFLLIVWAAFAWAYWIFPAK